MWFLISTVGVIEDNYCDDGGISLSVFLFIGLCMGGIYVVEYIVLVNMIPDYLKEYFGIHVNITFVTMMSFPHVFLQYSSK